MKSCIIITLAGALAANVNGVLVVDNANMANMAVTEAQASAASTVYSIGPHHFDNIQGPIDKFLGPVAGIRSAVSDASVPTHAQVDTFWPTTRYHVRTPIDPYIIRMNDVEAAPATLQTSTTKTKGKQTLKDCVVRFDPVHSSIICVDVDEGLHMKRTQMPDMPNPTSPSVASPTTTDSAPWRYHEYWWKICGQQILGYRPTQCATMRPPSFVTGTGPVLVLTTISSVMSFTTTEEATSTTTEPVLTLTTITSLMDATLIATKKATPTARIEDIVTLVTITSLMDLTPVPTEKESPSTTVNSSAIQTETPEIEYTFAEVDTVPIVTRRG